MSHAVIVLDTLWRDGQPSSMSLIGKAALVPESNATVRG